MINVDNRIRVSDHHKGKVVEYADENGLKQSEAAQRLIDQGLDYENGPDLMKSLIRESLLLSASFAILLSVFGLIEPVLFLFAFLAFVFMIGIILAKVITVERQRIRSRIRSIKSKVIHNE